MSCTAKELPDSSNSQTSAHDTAVASEAAQPSADDGQESASAAAAAAVTASSDASDSHDQLDQQMQLQIAECEELKQQGNTLYAQEDYDGALQLYWQAIDQAPQGAQERAVYFCNAAACYLKKQMWQLAVEQCTQALKVNDAYFKALVRRSTALEQLDDLEHALADAQKVKELDSSNAWAAKTIADLEPKVQQRQEKMKEEMIGKLKDLGNTLLGKFGMSLDNFKAEQDPNTGGYSIKFQQ
eukprot:GHRR01005491.1.p1 GENE.GHRR01005491.1~~GHRR01005491.1.p1  ORF type:complete len:241 (+),score=82.59 GHRR01005491.1:199-921(+)